MINSISTVSGTLLQVGLVQDGVSLYEVQKLLGHSNIAVTQVYSHLQPEGLHATVNKISVQLN